MVKSLALFFSFFIFLFLPWLHFEPGGFQLVDIPILILFILLCFLKLPGMSLILQYAKAYKIFLYLSLYTIIIMLINYIFKLDDSILILVIQNIYYIILISVFLLMIVTLYQSYEYEKFYKIILLLLLVDCILPIGMFFNHGFESERMTLTFNDPNQLGFFTLLNMAVFFYISLVALEKKIAIKKILSLMVININLFFLFLSASRSSFPVILLYGLSYLLIFRPKIRGYRLLSFYMWGGIAILIIIVCASGLLFDYMLSVRPSKLPTDSNGLFVDIYTRMFQGINSFDNIWNFIFGNGLMTTEYRPDKLEFHNNLMSIFCQTGVLGLGIYLYMNAVIFKELYKKGKMYLVPYCCYLFYSMFTYSYRSRANWLFLATVIFIMFHDKILKKQIVR